MRLCARVHNIRQAIGPNPYPNPLNPNPYPYAYPNPNLDPSEHYGPNSNNVAETNKLAKMCKKEDSKMNGCVLDAIKSTFCIGASCESCFNGGSNCSVEERIVIAFMAYVADLLMGCAMGFIAQPSFWYYARCYVLCYIYVCMDGWMDGWMDGCIYQVLAYNSSLYLM